MDLDDRKIRLMTSADGLESSKSYDDTLKNSWSLESMFHIKMIVRHTGKKNRQRCVREDQIRHDNYIEKFII